MRITPLRSETADTSASQKTSRHTAAASTAANLAPARSAQPAQGATVLASEVLTQASQSLQAMPDVDLTRVAEVRAALARGEISLDAGRLANIIADYHRS